MRPCFSVAAAIVALAFAALWGDVPDEPSCRSISGDGPVSKRVLVVGAGPSGLVALKEMLQHGHDAFAVEKAAEIGGVFGLASSMLYEGLHLTTSNYFTTFSDFPPKDESVRYWTAREYSEYLVNYTVHFGLMSKIHLSTQIKRAKLNSEGAWEVNVQGSAGGTEKFVVDGIVIATGTNHEAHMPTFPGFTGEVIHSTNFNNSLPFAGKRVLAVGTGESGSDVAHNLVKHAESVTVWARRPPLVAPRFFGRQLMRFDLSFEDTLLSRFDFRPWAFLETYSTGRAYTKPSQGLLAMTKWIALWSFGYLMGQRRVESDWMWMMHEERPDLYFQAEGVAAVTKNHRLAELVHSGEVDLVVAKTAIFNGTRVTFPDTRYVNKSRTPVINTSFEIDAIVCSCGYKFNFAWLEADVQSNPRTWFKNAFPPTYGDKLFFVGFARPAQGGLPVASELIARYGAMVFSRQRKLPEDYETISRKEGLQLDEHYAVDSKLKALIDFPAFTDCMTKLIGCETTQPSIFDLRRKLQYFFFARYAVWFRQRGPHAKPDILDSVLHTLSFGIRDLDFMSILPVLSQLPLSGALRLVNLANGSEVLLHKFFGHSAETGLHGNGGMS